MAPQVMHRCLAVISSWFILALHRSHYVCLGARVPPTKCSNSGDVCSSQLPGVAPFLLGVRQRRSSARVRARGKSVNIMFIIRIWQNREYLCISMRYVITACLRLFLPWAKHKMLWSESANTPPARPHLGVGLVQPHTHPHPKILPPGTPVFIISLTGEKYGRQTQT